MENTKNYFEEICRFRNLSLEEQFSELENKTNEVNTIIGEIYIQNKLFLNLNDRTKNREILSNLFNNSICVKEYGAMGMGDVEYRWLFAKNNLLIGINATSFYGGPLLVAGNYKVYRFNSQQELTINYENVENLLF